MFNSVFSRRVLLAASFVVTAGGALAQSISGGYLADGRNPNGSSYSGRVQISDSGGNVAMSWQVGSQAYSGTGRHDGQVLTVNWGDSHPVIYVIMRNGELHGTWANGHGLEKLTPQ